jgi:hypothetical protein
LRYPTIVITPGDQTYKVRTPLQDRVPFYELMRQGALNKTLCNSPLLDDRGVEALWTIYHNRGPVAHRMIIEHVLEHLTSVSGDLDHAPISPSTMISEMINALPDEDE